jgi:hypothetical protein
VTAVGGTSLGVGKNRDYLFETGWGTGRSVLYGHAWVPAPPGDFQYGGGGTSLLFKQPAYQRGVVPPAISNLFGEGPHRAVPDIAAVGDPNTGMLIGEAQVFPNGTHYGEFRLGGTSLCCPLVAGIEALANQLNGGSLGFVNPKLYSLYKTDAFNDYANGVNASDGTITSLRSLNFTGTIVVRPGYDDVTGLGTPNGPEYLRLLAHQISSHHPAGAVHSGRPPLSISPERVSCACSGPTRFGLVLVRRPRQSVQADRVVTGGTVRAGKIMAGVIGATTMVALVAAPSGATAATAPASSGVKPTVTNDMQYLGKASVSSLAAAARQPKPAATGADRRLDRPDPELPRTGGAGASSAIRVGDPAGTPVVRGVPRDVGVFDGLSHADQRNAAGGNQFSKEPPDGAICQGKNVALETVNSAVQFFSNSGIQYTPPLSLNEFFGLPPEIDRSKDPLTFPGPSLFDIRCLYDAGSGRMFLLALGLAQDRKTGGLTGRNTDYLAVSATDDPLGEYYRYGISVSGQQQRGCPCIADFPMIGADKNVFTISFNEFPFAGGYNGAKLAVLDKTKLESGRTGPVARFKLPDLGGQPSFTVQPSSIPPMGQYANESNGTQYFLSSIPSDNGDNRVGLQALVNTSAINGNPDAIRFKDTLVNGVLPYADPPKATQKAGRRPLGNNLMELFGVPDEPLRKLDTGSDKASTVEYADGKLWTVIDTRVGNGAGARAGLLYLAVNPRMSSAGDLAGAVAYQGYVAVNNAHVHRGDIAVTADGRSVAIVASLSGKDYFPSAVYGRVDPTKGSNGVDALHIYGEGAGPEDGFTCYKAFVGPGPGGVGRGCRWGDYSEINVGTDGNFYMEAEYITPRLRTIFANWGTAIARVPA